MSFAMNQEVMKRGLEDVSERAVKKMRVGETADAKMACEASTLSSSAQSMDEIQPFPFFFYKDYSKEVDADPFIPLTAPGRVPNFPAKMHAILARPELVDIVCWVDHGRAWRVLKPREFEIRVIPKFFEHAKFSSFVRQANGWGFRRLTSGHDRNAYFHPRFLRGLPHLAKTMKRPGVAKKIPLEPEHEPDLAKISELHPLPLGSTNDQAIRLECTTTNGPNTRVPVQSMLASYSSQYNDTLASSQSATPSDQEAMASFQQSLNPQRVFETNQEPNGNKGAAPLAGPPNTTFMYAPSNAQGSAFTMMPMPSSTLAVANQMAFGSMDAQYAAGFAAAAAMSHQQLQSVFMAQNQQYPPPPPAPNMQ